MRQIVDFAGGRQDKRKKTQTRGNRRAPAAGADMTVDELSEYIRVQYGAEAEFPWFDDPDSMVFRHADNRKWFAVAMKVGRDKLGLKGDEKTCVVNLKCDPELSLAIRDGRSIFPAYHMNKEKWITVIPETVGDDRLRMLLDMSFELTSAPVPKLRSPVP